MLNLYRFIGRGSVICGAFFQTKIEFSLACVSRHSTVFILLMGGKGAQVMIPLTVLGRSFKRIKNQEKNT